MELIRIYSCLCDKTRLRIINLLSFGPLCVCHFQELLDEPQVKISKHLNYLKTRGMVEARRDANWMVYSLPEKQTKELQAHLACLQDCRGEDSVLRKDTDRHARLRDKFENSSPICCAPAGKRAKQSSSK